jgi:GT2 family glycosyltransferase
MPSVSLVIVNYNSSNLVRALVERLHAHVDETIVVDNASDEAVDDASLTAHGAQIVRLARNRGYGGGANAGAAVAHGDVIVFANPDIEVSGEHLAALAQTASKPGVGLVAPRYLSPDGTLFRSAHRREPTFVLGVYEACVPLAIRLARRWPDWHPTLLSTRDHDRTQDVLHVLGALTAVDRGAFAQVGGFDEAFFMYREETDLCRRFRKRGLRIVHQADCQAVHQLGGSTPQSWKVYGHPVAVRSHYLYIRKHWGPLAPVVARAMVIASLAAWLVAGSNRSLAWAHLRPHLRRTQASARAVRESTR